MYEGEPVGAARECYIEISCTRRFLAPILRRSLNKHCSAVVNPNAAVCYGRSLSKVVFKICICASSVPQEYIMALTW